MTIENYRYRTSPLFLRNQFLGEKLWKIPNIPKCTLSAKELEGLRLIGYDRAKNGNDEHFQRMVHFFLYDYKFEDIWTDPEKRVEALRKYRAVLTPDFSMYLEMHPVLQLYNTFRNRWVGAYLANHDIKVVPTVNWGDESTFDFCFEGIAKGSAVAVSTYMASEHGNHKDQKEWFLKGYNEMLRRIEPEVVICYHTPFPEMRGNIVYVDYDLSSWKHDEDDKAKKYRITKRTGYVVFEKGGGSARGGDWQPSPNKPQDKRLIGKPGEVKETDMPNGDRYQDKIGSDGYADRERHNTDHGTPDSHSDPHDHRIDWGGGFPEFGKPENYFDGIVPEFKRFEVSKEMGEPLDLRGQYDLLRFETISEFKWSVRCGAEIGFHWEGHDYHVCSKVPPAHDADPMILFYEDYKEDTEQWFKTADEAMNEITFDGVRLRDIITQAEVTDRTI